jgi:putative DNA methylase
LASKVINKSFPLVIYYAFKQSDELERDSEDSGEYSTGWETMLTGVISSGYTIVGTWPLRTELSNRSVARGTNALASSIAIVCRPRPSDAKSITLQEFKRQLKRELKNAIKELLQSSIAPVDLPQSAIGPGIAIYSAYKSVLDSNGEPISISAALMEINKTLTEYLDESSDQFDQDTLWAIEWYKLNGYEFGVYGDADNLARAKNTSVEGVVNGGIAAAKSGKVSLIKRKDLKSSWDPTTDKRTSTWERMQYLVKVLEERGEAETAKLIEKLGPTAEDAKSLAYRIFAISEAKGWVEEARAYNALIMSWSEINKLTA